ncbi:TRAP transporter substrate-binding protein DctP [Cetobacterium sp. 8H]|uniref:C4-dicarboxylate TRAP transporter substrate-binding protein n=1 Tax=Cetobacterium sp. 8H TaxID=2759681 RepID=UPI00163B7EC8|nr:C4-dicarboxylate TRAP transporter substrate-binding protein [Cetobacterium sp. 8H]MBC2850455.1 TRAP transporter substrate-binding protein DctP [Cetobacterium sp. 8H]
MKKSLLGVLIFSILGMYGCGQKDEPKKEEKPVEKPIEKEVPKKIAKLSLVFQPTELVTQEIQKVSERIKEKTNGSVEIQVFPGGQLPVYKDNLEQVVNGADWIAVEDPSYLGDYVPDFTAIVGPMLYNSFDEYNKMTETDLVKNLVTKASDKGIKIMSLNYLFGFRNMITNKEIVTPEDLKGMKIRVPGSQLWIQTLGAMTASPTPMAFPETYGAIQQKVVDGLEGSIASMYGTKIYEVAKQMSNTKHFLGTAGVYISPAFWNKLNDNEKDIVEKEFLQGAINNNEQLAKEEQMMITKLTEAGVKFNDVDFESFSKLTEKVFTEDTKLTPGIHGQIIEELKKIRENNN